MTLTASHTHAPLVPPTVASQVTESGRGVTRRMLDSIGGALSFACALHCVALPFVITLLPLLGLSFLAHSVFEVIMIGIALSLATASFCWGVHVHGEWKLLLFIGAAAALFLTGIFHYGHSEADAGVISGVGHTHDAGILLGSLFSLDISDATAHWILMGFGGFTLALGHYLNDRLCRSCHDCAEHCHSEQCHSEERHSGQNHPAQHHAKHLHRLVETSSSIKSAMTPLANAVEAEAPQNHSGVTPPKQCGTHCTH